MGIYDVLMAPLELFLLRRIRAEIIAYAEKDVLEIGVGSGANFSYYDAQKVTGLTCLDLAHPAGLRKAHPECRYVAGSIEQIPFDADVFDSVVVTLVLCSVGYDRAVREVKRVLRPGGVFIFLEHVRPEGKIAGKTADSINPLWTKAANGCNLNRRTDELLMNSGFSEITIKKRGVFRYGIAKKAPEEAEA